MVSRDEKTVLDALREIGISVAGVWDLVNSRNSYAKAIPVLTRLLSEVRDARVKEAIARALTVRQARGVAARALASELRKLVEEGQEEQATLGWAIGNALAEVVTPKDELFDELSSLLRKRELGIARQMLTEALVKTKDPRALQVLVEILSDENLTGHALFALGKLGSPEAVPVVEQYLSHPNSWVRKEARKALTKLTREPASRLVH